MNFRYKGDAHPRPGESLPAPTRWRAVFPSGAGDVPLAEDSPLTSPPQAVLEIGRGTDHGWALDVNIVHGEVVCTPDGRLWYHDRSDLGTWRLGDTMARLPAGQWCDVTGQDLSLGSPTVESGRLLRFAAAPDYREPSTDVQPANAVPPPPQTWEPVPLWITDGPANVSSGFKVVLAERDITLPLNGAPVPFGRDPALVGWRGLVLPSTRVSRVHGFFRYNPAGETVEVYNGDGHGKPSTNQVYRIRPGQQLGTPIVPGRFTPVEAGDLMSVVDYAILVTHDPQHPLNAELPQ